MAKNRKLRVLFHTDYCGAPTGNGDNVKNILKYLYKTGKYELANYGNGVVENNPDFQKWPWKVYGSHPSNPQEAQRVNSDPGLAHKCGYGFYNLDKVITDFKPDIYVSLQDFWQNTLCENLNRFWWNKIECIISWTADSVPLLPDALNLAPKIKHHYVWANFAEKEFKKQAAILEKQLSSIKEDKDKQGAQNKINSWKSVKTLRGMMNTELFYPLANHQKIELRKQHGIDLDTFIIGTGFRNQLRKLGPAYLEGFKIFKNNNSHAKAKCLIYTDLREGWDLLRIMEEHQIDKNDVLFVYKCRTSNSYVISPFLPQESDNPKNGAKKSLVTVGIPDPLPVESINEILNMMDCFCLPITSGGQEYWNYQAKLCELPTLINNYSCFEDMFDEDTGSIEIEQAFTREMGTNFRKATVYPSSIAKQIKKVYEMTPQERKKIGQKGRKWILENASIEVVGKKWEELLDSLPLSDYNFQPEQPKQKNPAAQIPIIIDDAEWVKNLYIFILGDKEDCYDKEGLKHWIEKLKSGMPRQQIENYFREVAAKDIEKNKVVKFEDLIDKTDNKRLLVVLKESGGDVINSCGILENLKKSYPNHDVYFGCDPKFHELLDGNPYIYRALPYIEQMESELWAIGTGTNKGLFDVFIHLGIQNQRQLNYLSNHNLSIETK